MSGNTAQEESGRDVNGPQENQQEQGGRGAGRGGRGGRQSRFARRDDNRGMRGHEVCI